MSCSGGPEFADEVSPRGADLVADLAHDLDRLAGGRLEAEIRPARSMGVCLIGYLPNGGRLTAYGGESIDLPAEAFQRSVDLVAEGKLPIRIGPGRARRDGRGHSVMEGDAWSEGVSSRLDPAEAQCWPASLR